MALTCVLPTQLPEGAATPIVRGTAGDRGRLTPHVPDARAACHSLTANYSPALTGEGRSHPPEMPESHSFLRHGLCHSARQWDSGALSSGHQTAACLNPGVRGSVTSLGKPGLWLRNADGKQPIGALLD